MSNHTPGCRRQIKNDYEIGAISTSDGHSVREIGTSHTVLEQIDFSSPEKLRTSLRKSIREHTDSLIDQKTNSYLRTLHHGFKDVGLRFASKLGFFRRVN